MIKWLKKLFRRHGTLPYRKYKKGYYIQIKDKTIDIW